MDDFDGALVQIEGAVKLDPQDPTLLTTKALIFVRLGRYPAAAELYESILPTLSERTKKWRLSTRDQSAECYRRWSEQDARQGDQAARLEHIARGIEILDQGFIEKDVDLPTVKRFGRIIDELFRYAIQNDDLAEAQKAVDALVRHKSRYASHGLELRHLRKFRGLISDNLVLSSQLDGLALLEDDIETNDSAKGSGTVVRLTPGTRFGTLKTDKGQECFLHHDQLERPQDWRLLKLGQKVRFRLGQNIRGPYARDVEIVKE